MTTDQRRQQPELHALRRRLAAARQRAAYWSGRPSSGGQGFSPGRTTTLEADLNYEQALDDCEALADRIEQLTGRRPKVADYREEARMQFCERILPKIRRNTR